MDINGIFQTILDKLTGWLSQFLLMLPNLVAAVFIVVVFALAARLVRRGVGNLLARVSPNRQVNALLSTLAYVAVWATGIFVALGVLNLEKTVTTLLAGVGVIGLALGFAFQDIASNFISGVMLAFRRPFREGHVIQSNDTTGFVEKVSLRSTIIRMTDGPLVYLPNSAIFQNRIINYSELGRRRVDVNVGVAYGDDLEAAKKIAIDAVADLPARLKDRDVELYYEGFGASSVDFVLRFWIAFAKPPDYLGAKSEAIMRIKKAFDEAGITIPFPIRTLDFGVVGGEKLADAIPAAWFAGRGERSEAEAERTPV